MKRETMSYRTNDLHCHSPYQLREVSGPTLFPTERYGRHCAKVQRTKIKIKSAERKKLTNKINDLIVE